MSSGKNYPDGKLFVWSLPMGIVCIGISLSILNTTTSTGSLEAFIDLFINKYKSFELLSIVLFFIGVAFGCIGIINWIAMSLGSSSNSISSTITRSSMMQKSMPNGYIPNYPLHEISIATTDIDKMKVCYPMIKKELIDYLRYENELLPEAIQWIDTMIDYSVPGGKLNRGTTVVNVYTTIQESSYNNGRTVVDTASIARACVAGWSIEFLQAFFLVADDIMDDSKTRRGLPCWFRKSHVGLIAINDSFLLESFVFQILRTHFGNESYYPDLLELMIDVIQKTEIGQLLDLTSQPNEKDKFDLSRFTIERYNQIVKYKTSYYSFYLPTVMGMIIAGIHDKKAYDIAKYICCLMGEYFQIQDDYLDCYGQPEVIGKIGTDIQENKCSWLIVQALQYCTSEQRIVLQENYGKWDTTSVNAVKNIYNELNLTKIFEEYEETSYQHIQKELDNAMITNNNTTVLPRNVFELLLKKIYKRSK